MLRAETVENRDARAPRLYPSSQLCQSARRGVEAQIRRGRARHARIPGRGRSHIRRGNKRKEEGGVGGGGGGNEEARGGAIQKQIFLPSTVTTRSNKFTRTELWLCTRGVSSTESWAKAFWSRSRPLSSNDENLTFILSPAAAPSSSATTATSGYIPR